VLLAAAPATGGDVRERVEHHVREAEQIRQHFETMVNRECPRFGSSREWAAYLDGEVDRLVLLVAHTEQAWSEARTTGDDDIRRLAKGPRRFRDQAQTLVDKLQACASGNGTVFSPQSVWRRVEREVPQRRTEIALPE
jgi:hypothetical protein